MEEWVAIRELAKKGLSLSEIARQTGHDRKTIRRVLEAKLPKPHGNQGRGKAGKLEPFREYLLQRVSQGCLNGSVLLEEITKLGYTGKISILSHFLTPIRRELVRKQEVTERFETAPGKQGQVDWASFGKVFDPLEQRWRKLYGFVFTLGYSRAQFLEFVTSCDLQHFLECHLDGFASLGIPETILYDNLKTAILGREPDGSALLPSRFHEFALFHGYSPRFCQPYRARTKGKVERAIGYVRENFWVRVGHQVESGELGLGELNQRASQWVGEVANLRVHGTHGQVVAQRLAEEVPLLGQLGGRPRFDTDYRSLRRVSRDGRLSYRGQLYQVALSQALREVEVRESLTGKVTIRSREGRLLAVELASPSSDSPIYGQRDRAEAIAQAQQRGHSQGGVEAEVANRYLRVVSPEPEVERRDLSVYEEVARAARLG